MSRRLRRSRLAKSRAARFAVAVGLAAAILVRPATAQTEVTTKIHCDAPDIPAEFVATNLPRSIVVFEQAIRDGACTYHRVPVAIRPVRFVQTIAADSAAIEPYGYIWAIRLADGTVRYWFFWRAAHESMLDHGPAI